MPTLSVTSFSLPTITRTLLLAGLVAGAMSSACLPMPRPSKGREEDVASIADKYLERFPAREMCADSFPYRWWCPLASGSVARLSLPTQPTSYMGLSAWVADGDRVAEALARQVGLSVLHIDQAGASLVNLKADDAEERGEMIRAYVSVARALQGRGDEILVTEELHDYVDGQRAATPRYNLTSDGRIALWTGQLDSYIWEAKDGGWGRALVVVEDEKGGMYVSIFPMVGLTDAPMPDSQATDSTPEGSAAARFAPHVGHGAEVVALRHARTTASRPVAKPGGGGKGKKPTGAGNKSGRSGKGR